MTLMTLEEGRAKKMEWAEFSQDATLNDAKDQFGLIYSALLRGEDYCHHHDIAA